MERRTRTIIPPMAGIIMIISLTLAGYTLGQGEKETKGQNVSGPADAWTQEFNIEKRTLSDVGENLYFVLKPGFQLVLEGEDTRLINTVLDETKQIGAITTRVVEEREEEDGELVEISRNYFAICEETGDVFYFGEDVDIYKDGEIVSHSGAWLAGEGDSKPGMMIPGVPILGAKYYQEIAPGVALDRAEIVSLSDTLKTPAGTFVNCLRTEETSGLDPDAKEYKTYAPGIGLIQDEDLLLTKYGYVSGE